MIQGEHEYPIFWFSLEFDDRLWNVSTDRMFPEMLSEDEQQAYLEEFVNATLDATTRTPGQSMCALITARPSPPQPIRAMFTVSLGPGEASAPAA